MAYGYIYKIQNEITNQIYIGQTTQNLSIRFKQHEYQSRYECKRYSYLHKAINKYGISNFSIKLLCKADNQQELNNREAFCIRIFNSYAPINYNLKTKFSGRGTLSPETRIKLSNAHTGKIRGPHKPETKEKIRLSNIGKKRSKEICEKLSLRRTGQPNFHARKKIRLKRSTEELIFTAVFLAAKFLKVSRTVVTNALIGYRKPVIKGWEVSYR